MSSTIRGGATTAGRWTGVAQRLDRPAWQVAEEDEQDVILVVFVRGWRHDARSDDEKLSAFRVLLSETVDHEKKRTSPGVKPRSVLGLFVDWRGPSDFGLGGVVTDATLWGRQAAGRATKRG